MDNCIFCKIITGEIPSFKVWEDDNNLAFLTIRPHTEGHTLVVPKKHTDYIFDLSNDEYSNLMFAAKAIASKLNNTFKPNSGKVGMVVAGLEVPHAHIHLIPMNKELDLEFSIAQQATPEKLTEVLKKLKI